MAVSCPSAPAAAVAQVDTPDSEDRPQRAFPETTQRRLEGFCLSTPLSLSQTALQEVSRGQQQRQQQKQTTAQVSALARHLLITAAFLLWMNLMTVDVLRRRQRWSRTSQHSMKTPRSSNQPNPGTWAAGAPASSSSSNSSIPSTWGPQDSQQQHRAGTGSQTSAICHRVLHLGRAPLGRRRSSSLTAAMARSRWPQGTRQGGQRGGTTCSFSQVRTQPAAAAAVQVLRSVRYMCVDCSSSCNTAALLGARQTC